MRWRVGPSLADEPLRDGKPRRGSAGQQNARPTPFGDRLFIPEGAFDCMDTAPLVIRFSPRGILQGRMAATRRKGPQRADGDLPSAHRRCEDSSCRRCSASGLPELASSATIIPTALMAEFVRILAALLFRFVHLLQNPGDYVVRKPETLGQKCLHVRSNRRDEFSVLGHDQQAQQSGDSDNDHSIPIAFRVAISCSKSAMA